MKSSTIWIFIISAVNTFIAYACFEDIGFYAREETGALLGLPGMIACMILSGNVHAAYPKWLFPPINFVCDVLILLFIWRVITKVRKDV